MHPEAQRFFKQAKALAADKAVHALFLSRQKTVSEHQKTERAFDHAKKSYDTQLLENIAKDTRPGTDASTTSAVQYNQKIERLTGEIRALESDINAHPGIQALWAVASPGDAERDRIVADYKRFQFWFSLKELFWQLLFLLPIFSAFYRWSARSIKKDNPIQALIASHLLVIASLPILFKVIELVIDLIPGHFFTKRFDLLESWGLLALWYYFAIIAAIAMGLFLVYFIQRKVFNRQKVMQKRRAKGHCTACNKRLPPGAKSCPFCGKGQWNECNSCHQQSPVGGTYCIHCGSEIN